MRTKNKKGFTLIELLVVITIIGILATGATAVYTSQIQRARDSSRIQDLSALKGAIEQVYQEISKYPTSNNDTTSGLGRIVAAGYMEALPRDSKTGERCIGTSDTVTSPCEYLYGVDITSGVRQQRYNISAGLENEGTVTRAAADGGLSDYRMEIGNGIAHSSLATGMTALQSLAAPGTSCTLTNSNYAWIKGNCE
ncbi:MAG: prepilin-type N-terminal cleavage/methylation domain-containing protein [Candidatus Gracilibacteria bacterium]|nr:prepilin-type N-terminal cleavage/methylation domain-containing protein [Candidatus Gracilibacteria bacterium]